MLRHTPCNADYHDLESELVEQNKGRRLITKLRIRKLMPKTLALVVGAGASKEVNLPVGSELRGQIASHLDIRYSDGYRQSSGDYTIAEALREISRDVNPLLHSCWRIRDAMPQAISIDNFIDSHRNDNHITTCGKLAIARCILAAESASKLYIRRDRPYPKIEFSTIESTWFNSFFQLLTENCQFVDLKDRLNQIVVVTFNYDRCIEHYLHGAIQNYYGVSAAQATDAMSHLNVFHPYGSVGPLPWQATSDGIEFGGEVSGRTLRAASNAIRTFTEGTDPSTSSIDEIRIALSEAERVAFLGFAFHRLNLGLLFPKLQQGSTVRDRPFFATAMGISASDCQEIAGQLTQLGAVSPNRFQMRNDLTCAGLFREYWRSLSLT